MIRDFNDLVERARGLSRTSVAVAQAEDMEVLKALKMATDLGMVETVLVGNKDAIGPMAEEIGLSHYRIVDAKGDEEAARLAVKEVKEDRARVLMKGLVNTSIFMRALLKREEGLRTGRLLSLLAVYDLKDYHKLIYCSDSGVNVSPNLDQKKEILNNMVAAMKSMGMENPKIAALSANEMVNDSIESTVHAKALVDGVRSGELESCIIEGPVSFDIAFSKEAASHKGVTSEISGDLDGIIFSNMEVGNVLGKSWLHFNKAQWAGIVLGARNPIILGSRSDTPEIKLNSIALACLTGKNN